MGINLRVVYEIRQRLTPATTLTTPEGDVCASGRDGATAPDRPSGAVQAPQADPWNISCPVPGYHALGTCSAPEISIGTLLLHPSHTGRASSWSQNLDTHCWQVSGAVE